MVRKSWFTKCMAGGLMGLLLLGAAACGASNKGAAMDNYYTGGMKESMDMAVSSESVWDGGSYSKYEEPKIYDKVVESPAQDAGSSLVSAPTRKTIKTARLTLQTLNFDEFVVALEQKVAETGAYFQYADVSGSNYYGGRRYASYTIRVPEARLNEFLAGMEGIATVTNKTLGEQDVTLSYVDTESRISALEIEMESLMKLLEQAVNLDSIIKLQDRLTDVRYELENYRAQLRTYDDKISYSTVTVSVSEVTKVTEPAPKTIWERISSGWTNTMEDISEGAQNFVVWFITNIPYLVFWAAVIVVSVIFVKKKAKQRKEKKLEKQRENNATNMGSEE